MCVHLHCVHAVRMYVALRFVLCVYDFVRGI